MISRICIAIIALVFGGCSLAPQKITLAPVAEMSAGLAGKGQKVQIVVTDVRQSTVIGTRRSSDKDTGVITASNDIKEAIRSESSRVFGAAGFEVLHTAKAPAQLKIIVETLSYGSPNQNYVTSVKLRCVLRVEATKGSQIYKGRYETSNDLGVAFAPSRDINEREINKVLSRTLSRLANDQKLIRHLLQ